MDLFHLQKLILSWENMFLDVNYFFFIHIDYLTFSQMNSKVFRQRKSNVSLGCSALLYTLTASFVHCYYYLL